MITLPWVFLSRASFGYLIFDERNCENALSPPGNSGTCSTDVNTILLFEGSASFMVIVFGFFLFGVSVKARPGDDATVCF